VHTCAPWQVAEKPAAGFTSSLIFPVLPEIGLGEDDEQALLDGYIGPDPDVHAFGEVLHGLEGPALD